MNFILKQLLPRDFEKQISSSIINLEKLELPQDGEQGTCSTNLIQNSKIHEKRPKRSKKYFLRKIRNRVGKVAQVLELVKITQIFGNV